MKKYKVSKDTEVVLNGKKMLLEEGDMIGFPEEVSSENVLPNEELLFGRLQELDRDFLNLLSDSTLRHQVGPMISLILAGKDWESYKSEKARTNNWGA